MDRRIQPTIFDTLPPAAATDDPVTSHEAAFALESCGARGRQMAAVMDVVCAHPGKTSAELAKISGMDRHLVARRLPDLEKALLVAKGEPRICTASSRKLRAVTWHARDLS